MLQINFEIGMVKESCEKVSCRAPKDIYREIGSIGKLAQEGFFVITMNAKHEIIDKHMCGLGLLDCCPVHPREIFRSAINDSACSIILAHNHPSGDPTPSKDDCDITRRIIKAGSILGINVLDHVVIGRPNENQPGYVSMREKNLVTFGC